jgi:hypothetical protein
MVNWPGIGRLSAGHLSDIGRCPVNARSGLVARSEDGDEITESRSSRFCSTFFLTIFLKYRQLPVGYRPIVGQCQKDIGRLSYDYRTTIVRLSYDYRTTIGRLSYDYRTTIGRLSADYRPTIGRYPGSIGRLHIAHTYFRIVRTSAVYRPMSIQLAKSGHCLEASRYQASSDS